MLKKQYLAACAFSVLALGLAAPAHAQIAADQQAQPEPPTQTLPREEVQDSQAAEIVVTGSLIRGTPEDSALPVNVIGGDELAKMGAPSAVELFKMLPTASASLGEANQFDSRAQGAEGIATANLRGLSPQRTLVLLNSKRLATSGNGVPAVDINLIPSAAIGRIEVLKDGAAATYGSEAVAGVVNFITRTDQEGFRVSGAYKFVQDTDGDIDASVSYGHVGENFRVLAAIGFQKRGELMARDREFAVQPYLNNPQGGWTGGGNPANFLAVAPTGAPLSAVQPDAGCTTLSGVVGANGRCYTQYTGFDVISDLEKRGTAFIDFEADLTSSTKFEVTALYGRSTVPHYLTSPSYLLTQSPSVAALGGTNPTPFVAGFYVPAANPGLIAYRAANPGIPAAASGVVFPTLLFRPFLAGGNPAFYGDDKENGSSRGMRKSESMRFTADLTQRLTPDIDLNLGATYHHYYRYIDGYDSFGDRVQLALRGLGGPNCNVAANTPGQNGCQWLNPFSNAIGTNLVTGATNPQATAALANSADLARWFFVKSSTRVDTELFVADASISGKTGLHLPGGDVAFGVGAQYRYSWFDTRYGANNNLAINPCRESPINGNTNPAACAPNTQGQAASPPNGALGFLGTNRDSNLKGGVYALFGELQLPILQPLNVQLAARYEDYGGGVGSTFDPQIRARLQITDWLAVRGGFGTTFRAPTLANLNANSVTSLQLIGSTFKPVDVFGNANLKPESSKNYSGGILLTAGGFTAALDYFRYELEDALVTDPLSSMVATLFPSTGGNTCAANPTLVARFTFNTGPCTAATTVANISRVRTELQNGAAITNSGLDLQVDYKADSLFGSDMRFGAGATVTYTLEDKIGPITVAGVQVAQGYDGVGLLNYQTTLYPLPEWKGQGYIDLGGGPVDTRLTINYTDGLHDQRADARTGPFAPDLSVSAAGTTLLQGADINEFVTADFNIQVRLAGQVTLTGTVYNILDAQPPFAREDYNYEPFVGNPFGRMFKVGVSAQF
ncbi:TonB-dependent receptor plug domain-containing protein [Sphingomonas aracearum]|uniref:TonB-dependent receptor n=1 Tax=Sphingomonas aracearum TaxID=2283317 RepID=A0A369W073_9SPHN|nr:TonB-dependent receptor [Sphingomonas aracearum]RDE06770.1 TonB-dependent receptor [Sphingomonas aracearum]